MSSIEPLKSDDALGLGANFTANKAERSGELAGRQLQISLDDGRGVQLVFKDIETLEVSGQHDGSAQGDQAYEAQKVAEGLFLVAFQHRSDANASTSLLVDLQSGEVVIVSNLVGPKEPGVPAVEQTITGGRISGQSSVGSRIAETADLHGRRAMWVYSHDDIYEHLYLNSEYYAWHCLKGEEYPKADVDPCKMFKLRNDIYMLTFSEKVMTMAAAMVLDFSALRSYCAALGRDPVTDALTHFTFGAYGTILSQTDYPDLNG